MKIEIEKIKALCKEYDEFYDMYPEHRYEGKAVLKFMLEKLGVE